MCRTLNSDIVTQSNALSNQLSTHDTDIKSLLNNRGCVKSIHRGTKDRFTLGPNDTTRIDITNVNLDKSILLLDYKIGGDGCIIFNLLSNAIVIKNPNTNQTSTAWISGLSYQVVEFY